jgi:hypothetical protein
VEPVKTRGIVHRNLDAQSKRTLHRAALLLAASKSDNVRDGAFRVLVQRYGFPADHAELEIEQTMLAAEALRAIADVKA